jgi:hypothetical protein
MPVKLFNLDLHVSVIKDFEDIIHTLYSKDSVEITNWSISGHNWVFNQQSPKVKIINQDTWKNIDVLMIEKFNMEYDPILSNYDGFIVTHSPVFALIYEKYNKPIIVINSCRFDQPFCWNHNTEGFKWLVEGLNRLKQKGILHIVSNNKGDQEYLLRGSGLESTYIPSLCNYTHAPYKPTKNQAILYNLTPFIKTSNNSSISLIAPKLNPGYSWKDLHSYKAILHLPYEISTMSIFEQYTAGVPILFPTKDFYKQCHYNGQIINKSIYGSLVETDLDFWIERADFYNNDVFHNILYFNSFDEIPQIIENFSPNLEEIEKNRLKHKQDILRKWFMFLKNIFDLESRSIDWKFTTDYIQSDKLYYQFSKDPHIRYIKTDALIHPNIDWYSQQQHETDKRLTMITSHSDLGISKELYDANCDRAYYWITTNKYHKNAHLFGLPLGLTNHINGSLLHELYSDTEQIEYARKGIVDKGEEGYVAKTILCYMNFSKQTNPSVREKIWDFFDKKDFVLSEYPKNTKSARLNYLQKIARSKFVICPPGNGEDTHRLWETLYVGSIPIVLYNPVHDGWQDLPILFIKSWEDITEEFLNRMWIEMGWREYNFEKLTCSYWVNFIKNLCCEALNLDNKCQILNIMAVDIIKKHINPKKLISKLSYDKELIIQIKEFDKNNPKMVFEVNKFLAYFEEWNPKILF